MDPYVIYGHLESGDQISIPFSLILSTAVNLFYVLSPECLFCCSLFQSSTVLFFTNPGWLMDYNIN